VIVLEYVTIISSYFKDLLIVVEWKYEIKMFRKRRP
jgi:hypothetical protein